MSRLTERGRQLLLDQVDISRVNAECGDEVGALHLSLEASGRPAVAEHSGAVHKGVANLPCETRCTAEQCSGRDDAATDSACAAVEIDKIIDASTRPAHALGDRAEACIIGGDNGNSGRDLQHVPDRFVAPFEVRRQGHHSGVGAH